MSERSKNKKLCFSVVREISSAIMMTANGVMTPDECKTYIHSQLDRLTDAGLTIPPGIMASLNALETKIN